MHFLWMNSTRIHLSFRSWTRTWKKIPKQQASARRTHTLSHLRVVQIRLYLTWLILFLARFVLGSPLCAGLSKRQEWTPSVSSFSAPGLASLSDDAHLPFDLLCCRCFCSECASARGPGTTSRTRRGLQDLLRLAVERGTVHLSMNISPKYSFCAIISSQVEKNNGPAALLALALRLHDCPGHILSSLCSTDCSHSHLY